MSRSAPILSMLMVPPRPQAGWSEWSFCWASSTVCAVHLHITGCPRCEVTRSMVVGLCKTVPIQLQRRSKHKRSEEHTSELQSRLHLVCRLLLEKKKRKNTLIDPHNAHTEAT